MRRVTSRLGLGACATSAFIAACGSGSSAPPAGSATASARPTSAPHHPLEFAVLLLSNPSSPTGPAPPEQVTILDPNGAKHGQAGFTAPLPPMVGDAGAVLQFPVVTAAGAAYYVDDQGNLTALHPDAPASAAVAGFPFMGGRSQQEISIAVSPDGSQLEAMVLQLPAIMTNCQGPCGLEPGPLHNTLYAAQPGAPASKLAEGDIAQPSQNVPNVPRLFAWTAGGPVALDTAPFGTQDGFPGFVFLGYGTAHFLNGSGQPAQPVGGTGCMVDDIAANGAVLCDTGVSQASGQFDVRSSDGTLAFSASPTHVGCSACQVQQVSNARLSPDATRIALAVQESPPGSSAATSLRTLGEVLATGGAVTQLADGFQPEGWLDGSTLIGTTDQSEVNPNGASTSCPTGANPGNSSLSIVRLANPTTAVPLHACGVFAGVVRAAS